MEDDGNFRHFLSLLFFEKSRARVFLFFIGSADFPAPLPIHPLNRMGKLPLKTCAGRFFTEKHFSVFRCLSNLRRVLAY
jgi:hypothetical protein